MRLATQPLILTTFIVGLVILVVGGVVYGRICERVMKPTDAETPATALRDDVDFVPMAKWRNSLIELLNIAGTGPILGPIQGILFGPIAFITIPIGCIFAGAFHDYMVGMISIRNKGGQTPDLIRLFLGPKIYYVYAVFVCLLLLLVGVVFVYTPGDIFILQILHQESTLANPVLWIVYGVIFGYYVVAALFPIDKIIGRVYPIFGAILLLSAVGGLIAIIGIIVLPITSGDTALRALRLTLGDALNLDMRDKANVLKLAIPIFAIVFAVLIWAKADTSGFNVLWRYFSWANETIGAFALTMIAMYMARNRMPYAMALVPGAFYLFVVSSYILNAQIGFHLPWVGAYIGGGACVCLYVFLLVRAARRMHAALDSGQA